jgi:phosphohistidine swiveling domain-containing protein
MTFDHTHWQRRLDELLATHRVPGASLAVLADGRIHELAGGVLHRGTGVTATTDSIFQIGSITKVHTATLIMQLADSGELDLDRPVIDTLPEFGTPDPEATKIITPRHLLSHTGGMTCDFTEDTGRGDDCLARYVTAARDVPLDCPPGTGFSYGSSGYVVLGRLAELITGKTWDAALQERLCEPLGLTHTVSLPEEDPTPVFSAMAGYLRLTDRDAAPDVRFERAAVEAEEALDRLVGRASRTRPLRAMVGGVLLRRWRALAGLRELPKFVWIVALRDIRRQLLLAGAELAGSGRLERADDIMFLTLAEAEEGVAGTDQSQLAATRRADYEREFRRQQVPGLLLSDGTMPEALPDPDAIPAEEDDHRMVGMPAAAGRATGTVRVVHDPTTARIEPGDILVAPTTDPGWTPLFLTLGGLITETGSPIAHGPTVAREYGIPAVICVRDATTRLKTGQMVTIDGASGVVIIEDEQPT